MGAITIRLHRAEELHNRIKENIREVGEERSGIWGRREVSNADWLNFLSI